MRLIALPSVFEEQWAAAPKPNLRPLWVVLAIGVVAPLAAAAFYPGQIPTLVTISGGWAIVTGLIIFTRSAKPVGSGEAGERYALRALEPLSDSYVAITNCKIPGYEQIGDLDIVVIGPHGIVVIEVKRFQSRVIVDRDTWTILSRRHGAKPIRSVSMQLRDEMQALTKYLGRQRIAAPVHGIIAINPNASIEIVAPPPYPMVTYDNLATAVGELPAARPEPLLDIIERKLCPTASA
jgi:hypothetical protein